MFEYFLLKVLQNIIKVTLLKVVTLKQLLRIRLTPDKYHPGKQKNKKMSWKDRFIIRFIKICSECLFISCSGKTKT